MVILMFEPQKMSLPSEDLGEGAIAWDKSFFKTCLRQHTAPHAPKQLKMVNKKTREAGAACQKFDTSTMS